MKRPAIVRQGDWSRGLARSATILRLLGYDNERFSYNYQGLDQRLTGVKAAAPIQALMA